MYINNNKGDNRICYLLFFIKNLKYFLLSESLKIEGYDGSIAPNIWIGKIKS